MKKIFLPLITVFVLACGSTNKVTTAPETIEKVVMDTVYVDSSMGETEEEDFPYRSTFHRTIDIVHTKLDLRFDWPNEAVIGKAWIDVTPVFYKTDKIVLDAKGFDFKDVKVENYSGSMDYKYADDQLVINLSRPLDRGQKIRVYCDYVAHPSQGGGSSAITSDKGLFFINPQGTEDKPQQIWTQGETEHNSKWFPTVDKPNERCTQEISMTVRDEFETLSNGVMTSSKKNPDGTRTDTWVMDMPHAPYLFMLAVGDFAVVKDKWQGKDLYYIVEKDYEQDAKLIFNHTPEMLTFFSEAFGMVYPWQKYAQIVVRDYVSGAMENTTSVIFGDFVQKHADELLDSDNDGIVAHEMAHHWFGDYVTCESWSNLTLNEGFANYSEYLWYEYKYGAEKANSHRLSELRGYLNQAASDVHPLIDFHYDDKESMFDAHSYNKGGLVLHMLRDYVGDEAFFEALRLYLEQNALSAVEVQNLRLAFEDVTGEDLNWFFNQWYLSAGHPKLDINYEYNESESRVKVTIDQTQTGTDVPAVFRIPAQIATYDASGKETLHDIVVDQRNQEFYLDVTSAPSLVNFNPYNTLLIEENESRTADQYMNQYKYSTDAVERYVAAENLMSQGPNSEVTALLLNDESEELKAMGVATLGPDQISAESSRLLDVLKNESSALTIRKAALRALSGASVSGLTSLLPNIISSPKSSAGLAGSALASLVQADPQQAAQYIPTFKKKSGGSAIDAVSAYLVSTGERDDQYMLDHLTSSTGFGSKLQYMQNVSAYAQKLTGADQTNFVEETIQRLTTTSDVVSKVAGVGLLSGLGKSLVASPDLAKKLIDAAQLMISNETNEQIKDYMKRYYQQ